MNDIQIPLTTTDIQIEDGKLVINRIEDVEPLLDQAKELSRAGFHKTGMGDKHAASFPRVVVEKYCNDNGITFAEWCADPVHIRRMCNDPDLSGFRVWPGRV